MSAPQDDLVKALLKALPDEVPTPVEEKTKKALAKAVRKHYKKYPEALRMQASGKSIPPTVDNHS
jgi:coproporphyrinogen III oxidase